MPARPIRDPWTPDPNAPSPAAPPPAGETPPPGPDSTGGPRSLLSGRTGSAPPQPVLRPPEPEDLAAFAPGLPTAGTPGLPFVPAMPEWGVPLPVPTPNRGTRDREGALRQRVAHLRSELLPFWSILWGSAKLALVVMLTYSFLFNFSVVRGSSMHPGIHDGDRILIDHLAYLFGDVERGDIVVLKYPLDPDVDYIKRVIGMPGDEVEIVRGQVFVNGAPIQEPYINGLDPFTNHDRVRVKPAHFFVLGDNRERSSDSREFGLVPRDYVRGQVEVRVWPPSRFGRID